MEPSKHKLLPQYILNRNGKPVFVVLPVEQYQALVDEANAASNTNQKAKQGRNPV